MYLRKTTTAQLRGVDVLGPLYQQLAKTHSSSKPIDVLQIGAGVGIKALAKHTNTSSFARRIDSLLRSLPLPISYYASYEPMEIYDNFSNCGYITRLKVADINPNVLAVVQQQKTHQQMALELIDICNIAEAFLIESFDICVVLNVFPHISCQHKRLRAIRNLVRLTNPGGYILGAPMCEYSDPNVPPNAGLRKVGKLLYRKVEAST